MFKKANVFAVAIFLTAQSFVFGLTEGEVQGWRNNMATRDVSGSNIVTALNTMSALINQNMNAQDANLIIGFCTTGNGNLHARITDDAFKRTLSSAAKNNIATAINNFFTAVSRNFALNNTLAPVSGTSYKRTWTAKYPNS